MMLLSGTRVNTLTHPKVTNMYITDTEQKQPLEVFCMKSCSKKFRKVHRKTPVPGSLFQ